MLSVCCAILPLASGGSSSGLIGVSAISLSASELLSKVPPLIRLSIIQRISVLGIVAFTPYMLMWSPL